MESGVEQPLLGGAATRSRAYADVAPGSAELRVTPWYSVTGAFARLDRALSVIMRRKTRTRRGTTTSVRNIVARDAVSRAAYGDNVVHTSRYTAATFVPIFLLEQFARLANAYYLLVIVLQCAPAVSTTSGVPTSSLPLAFVLLFEGVVTAREDYYRHRDDARANAHAVLVARGGDASFIAVPSSDIRCGDVIKLRRGEDAPADCLFLAAAGVEAEERGECHVQTAQLDGETNLKPRRAPITTATLLDSDAAAAALRCRVVCGEPNEHFGSFVGALTVGDAAVDDASDVNARAEPLDAESLLLRGSVLRNVPAAYAIVLYTGADCKVRLREARRPASKTGALEARVNRFIIILVLIQLTLCVGACVGYWWWDATHAAVTPYLALDGPPQVSDATLRFFTEFLLLSFFVPISLYVSIKVARTAQKSLMELDEALVHVEAGSDRRPLIVRSMDLNDELGRVTHVFADKTGTLTDNDMAFCRFVVGGVPYGLGTTQIGVSRRRRAGEDVKAAERAAAGVKGARIDAPHVRFVDGVPGAHNPRFLLGPNGDLNGASAAREPQHTAMLHLMLLSLAANHSASIEPRDTDTSDDDDGGSDTGEIGWRGNTASPYHATRIAASSPDEEAFVLAASHFGLTFAARVRNEITLTRRDEGQPQIPTASMLARFRVVALLPYSPARKMMSVLLEPLDASADALCGGAGGRYVLLSKGADSRMLPRCRARDARGTAVMHTTENCLREWALDGLRVLVWAFKFVSRAEGDAFVAAYTSARANVSRVRTSGDGADAGGAATIEASFESDLELLGATAVEDRLQHGVPQTLSLLQEAGIKVFMLTGDRTDTAVNIAFAARLLSRDIETIYATAETLRQATDVEAWAAKRAGALRSTTVQRAGGANVATPPPLALIIDESALDALLVGDSNRANLLVIVGACRAVVCCRCRPDQKKLVVELVKHGVPGACCLAVGDGANDVAMLQGAHVGVGIIGVEGQQAANASDYAIGRFRFLSRLLLVHGRWNYNRIALLVLYSFWKNALFAFGTWAYNSQNGFSGQRVFVEWASQTFNGASNDNAFKDTLHFIVAAPSQVSTLSFPSVHSCSSVHWYSYRNSGCARARRKCSARSTISTSLPRIWSRR